jgi:hypothetical protein
MPITQLFKAFWPNIHATAAHEVGHAIVASHIGLNVVKVQLLHGGRGGNTTIQGYVPAEDELQVAVAGFVAEEFAHGNTGLTGFTQIQYAQDYAMAQEIAKNDVNAIREAIAQVAKYLQQPEVAQFAEYLTNVLEKKGELQGALVKVPC